MRRLGLFVVLLSLVVLVAAEATRGSKASERETLLQLDREFDAGVAAGGAAAWASYFADNGTMVGRTGAPVSGPEAIRQAMAPLFGNPNFSLRWQPTEAEILIPGDLGYTTGRYERRAPNADGKLELERGRYVTLWRKQPDGAWRIVFDTGAPDQSGRQ